MNTTLFKPSIFDFFQNELESNSNYHVLKKEDGVELQISIPGRKKEDIKLSYKDGYIFVYSEKKQESDNFFEKRNFSMKFFLGDRELNSEKISASYDAGVLRVNIPKNDKQKKSINLIEIK